MILRIWVIVGFVLCFTYVILELVAGPKSRVSCVLLFVTGWLAHVLYRGWNAWKEGA